MNNFTQNLLAYGGVALMLSGCGIRAQGIQYRPERELGLELTVSSYMIGATADATVHDTTRWEDKPIGEENWLMSGADALPSHWFAYLEFPIEILNDDRAVVSAELSLPVMSDPPMPGEASEGVFIVYPVVGDFEESSITWNSQPRVATVELGRFTASRGSSGEDRVELTDSLQHARDAGLAHLRLIIVPEDPSVDFRRRWYSIEYGEERNYTSSYGVPYIDVTMADRATPRSAAQRDALVSDDSASD